MSKHSSKILLLDTVHPDFPAMLESIGYEVHIKSITSESELKAIIAGYKGLIVRSAPPVTASIIESADSLRFIARAGSGIESIDYAFARKKGIEVIHSPEGNSNAVGEHALGLTIGLLKKIPSSWMQVKQGLWHRESNRGTELAGMTVGIIGYGNTGTAFARKLKGMDVKILAFDKYKTGFSDDVVKETDLETLSQKSDVISFHVPLTQETHHYADNLFFSKLGKSAIVLNTSRGSVVSSEALVKAMKEGKVVGAGLDVVEWETYDFHLSKNINQKHISYLLQSDNVIITPHIAGITHEARLRHARVLIQKISLLKLN